MSRIISPAVLRSLLNESSLKLSWSFLARFVRPAQAFASFAERLLPSVRYSTGFPSLVTITVGTSS